MQYIDTYDGNGTQTTFCLTGMPIDPTQIQAEFDGFTKTWGHDFCVQHHWVIFIEAPQPGTNNVIISYDGTELT